MKGIVLAAGRGSRLGTLTAERPKPLLEIAGQPLLEHTLRGLTAAGVDDVTVVTGYLGEMIEAAFGDGRRIGLRLRYERQEAVDGTARATALAQEWVGNEPFFFGWGDIFVWPANFERVVRAAAGFDGSLAVNPVDDPAAGAAVYFGDDGVIARLVEKPPPGTSATRWNNAGFGVLSHGIWAEVDSLEPSACGEYELPQAIAAWIDAGARLRAVPVEGPWFDIGTRESLESARMSAADTPGGHPALD